MVVEDTMADRHEDDGAATSVKRDQNRFCGDKLSPLRSIS